MGHLPLQLPSLETLQAVAAFFQDLATIAAILAAGYWFFLRRQRLPRANLTHALVHKRLPDDNLLLHAAVTISNPGDVLLSLVRAEAWVQQVLPVPEKILDALDRGEKPVPPGETEIEWPRVGDTHEPTWDKGSFEIEPGETDQVLFDFVIPADVETVNLYTYFWNARKKDPEIGWRLTTVYDLRSTPEPNTTTNTTTSEE